MSRTHLLLCLAPLVACAAPESSDRVSARATGSVDVVFDEIDGTSRVESIAGLSSFTHDLSAPPSGPVHERVLAIRVAFSDAPNLCSAKEAQTTVFESVAHHLGEVTDGWRTLDGDVVGPYVVPRGNGCDLGTWQANALAAVEAEGVDPTAYDRWMFLMPPIPCSFAGAAFVNGSSSFINGPYCRDAAVLLHELGHNFGLLHAATPTYEYGDRSDPMGAAAGQRLRGFHAPHSIALGVVGANAIEDVSGDRRGPVAALASSFARRAPKILRVGTPRSPFAYFVSFRAGIDHDAELGVAYRDRVAVHRVVNTPGPATTVLLASLANGQTFDDGDVQVTAYPGLAAQADVDLRLTCRRAALRFTGIGPQWIRPGGSVEQTIVVESHDGPGCAARVATLVPTASHGLEVETRPSSITITPGEDTAFTIFVRAAANTPGSTSFVSLPIDDAQLAFEVNVDVTPPSTPTGLTAIVFAKRAVRVEWPHSHDDGPDIRYAVLRDGAVLKTTEPWDPGRPVSFEDTSVPRGAHTYAAQAIDRAGNVSAISTPVNVFVP